MSYGERVKVMAPGLKRSKRKAISVVVSDEARRILDKLAAERTSEYGYSVFASDVVRDAIEDYLNERGYEIKIEVDRGGYRGDKDD